MKRQEDGYILASALGVLLAISIVAAALVGSSADSLSRVVRAETAAKQEAALRSALSVVISQLPLDPRRRHIDLSQDFSVALTDAKIAGRIGWETDKLDINRAAIDKIAELLQEAHFDPKSVDSALAAVRDSRLRQTPLRLIDDLGVRRQDLSCIASLFTVFGGSDEYHKGDNASYPHIGLPAAGSRLSIDLATDGRIGLSVVVLMTGDTIAAVRVLDWRSTDGKLGDECNATRNHA